MGEGKNAIGMERKVTRTRSPSGGAHVGATEASRYADSHPQGGLHNGEIGSRMTAGGPSGGGTLRHNVYSIFQFSTKKQLRDLSLMQDLLNTDGQQCVRHLP